MSTSLITSSGPEDGKGASNIWSGGMATEPDSIPGSTTETFKMPAATLLMPPAPVVSSTPHQQHQQSHDEELRSSVPSRNWHLGDYKISRSLLVFFSQVVLIYVVVGFSIYNLTFISENTDQKLWVATLASGIGYILPNPTMGGTHGLPR
jgi:hypothetical protein